MRREWKRRFFVLDSLGCLYYYSNKVTAGGPLSLNCNSPKGHVCSCWRGTGLFMMTGTQMWLRQTQLHMLLQERVDNQKTPQNTVNLLCSTIKPNPEDDSIRFCFRVVSPEKVYSLQVGCT